MIGRVLTGQGSAHLVQNTHDRPLDRMEGFEPRRRRGVAARSWWRVDLLARVKEMGNDAKAE